MKYPPTQGTARSALLTTAVIAACMVIPIEGMRSARFAEPPDENLVGAVEEDHLDFVAVSFERRQGLLGTAQKCARPNVDPETDAF